MSHHTWLLWVFVFILFCCFETRSHYVAQVGFKLLDSSNTPASVFWLTGATDELRHAWLYSFFSNCCGHAVVKLSHIWALRYMVYWRRTDIHFIKDKTSRESSVHAERCRGKDREKRRGRDRGRDAEGEMMQREESHFELRSRIYRVYH